jgi:hypothetical protein
MQQLFESAGGANVVNHIINLHRVKEQPLQQIFNSLLRVFSDLDELNFSLYTASLTKRLLRNRLKAHYQVFFSKNGSQLLRYWCDDSREFFKNVVVEVCLLLPLISQSRSPN